MSGGLSTCLGRIALLCATPVAAAVSGVEADRLVDLLSLLAVVFEVVLYACPPGGRKGRQVLRPARFFPLQLGVLYCMQVWLLVFNNVGGPGSMSAAGALELVGGAALPGGGEAFSQPFVLDAPQEALRWNPKTISVVLPCAEEREYAVRTVKSFFEMTPREVLHEIVVVDDGSDPPLSQMYLTPEMQQQYRVKICRHEKTVGLIGAKKTGGDAASGDIVAFFDCHVAPQQGWYKDFLRLIGENYRRMVVPQITALDVNTWTRVGRGGGMSKCYVTWDGDFKWGGPKDQYMGMLSGGLAGMSKRWWNESGGYDDEMLGWGGENIDQGVRMWVCGGEIVAAPTSYVAHMWRTGDTKTSARYKHVGDTMKNRARAIHAWFGEFAKKLEDFPAFAGRRQGGGEHWYGDMSTFDKVKQRLQGCRPFAWYLRRFKSIYEDAGIIPPDIFMLKEETSGMCVRFMGGAGTSSTGHEGVQLMPCREDDHRFFWHLGNKDHRTGSCCSGLRAWNTDQCFQGHMGSGICEITGSNRLQHWRLTDEGLLQDAHAQCIDIAADLTSLLEEPCDSVRSTGGVARFSKVGTRVPLERELYDKAMAENPEMFRLLDEQLRNGAGAPRGSVAMALLAVAMLAGGPV